jgi:excinuclease ABC subunit B
MIPIRKGGELGRNAFLERLVDNIYERNDYELKPGRFRVRGDVVDVMPSYMEHGLRVEFFGDTVEALSEFEPLTGDAIRDLDKFDLYPANQYVRSRGSLGPRSRRSRPSSRSGSPGSSAESKFLEAQRLKARTNYDIEMLSEMGFCNGIENYSLHFGSRKPGDRPSCLIDFFPKDFLLMVDESHATVPQIGAMYNGDKSRKTTLVNFGFRLPSALDNRPQNIEEFDRITGQTLYVSATPSPLEIGRSTVVAEQIIRPTGLLDPEISIRPIKGQVEDLIGEIKAAAAAGERVLVTTLTKRLSEDLTTFLREAKVRVEYLHSDIDTIERIEILRNLRLGDFDALIGINLLREGLDLPEVALVAILDADKEGFLRSETSLIQTAGRAARHEKGRVIFYADTITGSIARTIEVTNARRKKQIAYNEEHGIVPRSTKRGAQASLHGAGEAEEVEVAGVSEDPDDVAAVIAELEDEMREAADKLEFEKAALIRDQIDSLKSGKFKKLARSRSGQRAGRALMIPIEHRKNGYALLSGDGLEIGALHEPAQLPAVARVRYLDALSEGDAAALFREIPSEKLVKVDVIGDLDGGVLAQFPDGAFDFVVMNHVLEHIANPVKAVRETFRICRAGGIVILAIPDKDYTFDRGRELTTWEHLWSDYEAEARARPRVGFGHRSTSSC